MLAAYSNGLAEVRALPVDEGYDEGVFELCGDLFPQLQNLFVVSGFSVGVFVQPLVFVALRLQAFESGVLGFQRRIAGEYLNLELVVQLLLFLDFPAVFEILLEFQIFPLFWQQFFVL